MNKMMTLMLLIGMLMGIQPQQLWAEDGLGRLFSSPVERKKLDMLRKQQKSAVAQPLQQSLAKPAYETLSEPISLQGYVKRSDGVTTLWVNHKSIQENHTEAHIEIGSLQPASRNAADTADRLQVRIPASEKMIYLMPGQHYDPETGRIIETNMLENTKQLRLEQTGVVDDDVHP